MLPEMKRCLVRSPSGKQHVTVSFQSPAVPRRRAVPHEGRAQGQHLHRALSTALTPAVSWASCQLQVWRDSLPSSSCGQMLWDCGVLSPKGHPHHLLRELVGLCSGCPCAMWVLAARDELQAALPTAEPGPSLLLGCPFPINCRCCQRVSWFGFLPALLLQESIFGSCFSPSK